MKSLRLAPLFTDHLVLQRDRENALWGWDEPGREVTLTVEGVDVPARRTTTAENGRFSLVCPALRAGGPYRLCIEGSETRVLEDVMAGEVWLASGQSNMEWKVSAAANADAELEAANFPNIRMFKVEPRPARKPVTTANGEWLRSTPEDTAGFSAVGFFFARELEQKLGVPVGIIDATWGGTSIDSWLGRDALLPLDPASDERWAELTRDEAELERVRAEYERTLATWESGAFPVDGKNEGFELGWARADFDDRAWKTMNLPAFWQHRGLAFNGVVWFRRSVELSPELAEQDLVLSLGAIDDFDHTYFNGELVGSLPDGTPNAFQTRRRYVVPGRLVRAGTNVLAVRVFDHFGEGGFAGPANAMFLEAKKRRVRLDGEFRFAVEREVPLVPGEVYATYPQPPLVLCQQYAPSALHNGMLAPLFPYGVRGALWYQGESDAERHAGYTARQIALVRELRSGFGQPELPFLFVQLAGYGSSPSWPWLREAQSRALSEPFTAMATAIDLGDRRDIHPRDKQEVGRRLALLARARVYGEAFLEDSGPVFERALFDGTRARVFFSRAHGLRSRSPSGVRGFTLAGPDGLHHPALAFIEGETVVLSSEAVPEPRAVRYAWDDFPATDLENSSGLPAFPFCMDSA
jgi:sialate O-acetylesterase